nr:MAG TPA: hypothetical protein [Caudoviricetes sp.]
MHLYLLSSWIYPYISFFYVYRYIYIHRNFILAQALLYLLSLYMEYVSRWHSLYILFASPFSRSCDPIP